MEIIELKLMRVFLPKNKELFHVILNRGIIERKKIVTLKIVNVVYF